MGFFMGAVSYKFAGGLWYGHGPGCGGGSVWTGYIENNDPWLFFGSMLADVEMALAKSDLDIGRHYRALAPAASQGVFEQIDTELRLARSMILKLKEQDDLLEGEPTLQRSIRLRNPYVDPMSLLQVDLLKRWRADDRQDESLLEALLVTVNGIARGIQNTG